MLCVCVLIAFPFATWAQAKAPDAPGRTDEGTQPRAIAVPAPLWKVAQLRRLDEAQAANHLLVRLRGVITAFSGWRDYYFIQDSSGGIAVNREDQDGIVHVGDELELTGISDKGRFATSINSRHVRVIGKGRLPAARVYTYAEMVGGSQDSQWVGIRGIVEAASIQTIWDHQILVLSVESGGGAVSVRIMHYEPGDAERLRDSLVQINGVCGTAYNDRRQFTGLRLFVTDAKDVKVIEPGPKDPYALPVSPLRSVLQFNAGSGAGHRVRIAGVVTYQDAGRSLDVQNGEDGIIIYTSQAGILPLGSEVEAVGFPSLSGYSPDLRNAEFRVVGPVHSIAPVPIEANDFLQHEDTFDYTPYDGRLVRLTALVVSSIDDGPGRTGWLLREGKRDFFASLDRRTGAATHTRVAVGSTVLATGVLQVEMDEDRQPQSFRLLLRAPEDLVVTARAPWWTPKHLFSALAIVLLATLGTALWGILLRSRVRQQTRMLRESEERFRNQAQHDALTGLTSRSFFLEKLDAAIRKVDEKGGHIGILMIDLDHFKQVNDTLGHPAGDQLLCIVAQRIRASVRATDTVARMGGDEFIVLLEGPDNLLVTERIGSQVVENLSAEAEVGGQTMRPSASVGACLYPDGSRDVEALLHHADSALYKAKAAGRNALSVYRESDERLTKAS